MIIEIVYSTVYINSTYKTSIVVIFIVTITIFFSECRYIIHIFRARVILFGKQSHLVKYNLNYNIITIMFYFEYLEKNY